MNVSIGQKMKALRQEKKLTLKEVAEQTGFSISFLSQFERGKSSATLESLKKIAWALGTNPSYFFDDSPSLSTNQEESHLQQHQMMYQNLAKDLENQRFAPLKVTLLPGENEGNLFRHDGQEFLYVLEGELTVQIEEDKLLLKKDESIMFDATRLHYWYNYTNHPVIFLCISMDH